MTTYKSKTEYRSRLSRIESDKLRHQTWVILLITLITIFIIVRFFLPLLIKGSIFIGDLRQSSVPIETEKSIPPPPPILHAIPIATSSANIDLSGIAPVNTNILLYLNGLKIAETVADSNDTFNFYEIKLQSGENEIYAISRNQSNKESTSVTQIISLWTEKPNLSVITPLDNQKFYGSAEQLIHISGSTSPNTTLILNGHNLVVSPDGSFKSTYLLSDGENKLEFLVTDKANNQTNQSLIVHYYP